MRLVDDRRRCLLRGGDSRDFLHVQEAGEAADLFFFGELRGFEGCFSLDVEEAPAVAAFIRGRDVTDSCSLARDGSTLYVVRRESILIVDRLSATVNVTLLAPGTRIMMSFGGGDQADLAWALAGDRAPGLRGPA